MEKYYPKIVAQEDTVEQSTNTILERSHRIEESTNRVEESPNVIGNNSRMVETFNATQLPSDPGLRIPITDYSPKIRDQVRRTYLRKGPCQSMDHTFSQRKFGGRDGGRDRGFIPSWYVDCDWLEYSKIENAVFCLYCYLFKPNRGNQSGGDSFVREGFNSWNNKARLKTHVGKHDSQHNQARMKCDALMNQDQHVQTVLHKQSKKSKDGYRIRLNASIDCVRHLLEQGSAFRGHDESEDSLNPDNFLALLKFLANHNDVIKGVTLENAYKNNKLTSPDIQMDIVSACATETINVIMKDVGESLFSILVDESRDVSLKEQMSVVLRYVEVM